MPELVQPEWPAPPGVHAFSTTRHGGFSSGPWRSFNLGDHCGDDPRAVRRNRQVLRSLLPASPPWLQQVHGRRVVGHRDSRDEGPHADGIVARQPGAVCAVLTADCLPVLFCDRRGSRVAAAHAGWRGLAAGILEATVAALETDPREVLAWLGPGIGPAAYEVGPEVVAALAGDDGAAAAAFSRSGERWRADLYTLTAHRLKRAGVRSIHGGGFCTATDGSRFFSHRRDGVTGRMATVIWLERTTL
jgi:YfiH family protein